jgi:hypothetical protein
MRKLFPILTIALAVLWVCASPIYAQQKLAQTGMKFLSVGTDPRATAIGEAMTAVEGYSSSMFYNPAGMAWTNNFVDFSLGKNNWIADIKHTFGSVAFSPFHGDWGVIGLTLHSVDYGEMQETIRWDNEQGFLDIGTFKPTAFMIGIGYARALSDRFAVGGNVKYVTQSLGGGTIAASSSDNLNKVDNTTNVLAFDFGILYKTGFKSLNFGMTVRNFSREIRYQKESFQLPLIFRIGLSLDILDFFPVDKETHAFLLSADATHPRDYPEQINIGGEYVFMQTFALRGGYMLNNDEYGVTYGLGVHRLVGDFRLGIDYSYVPFGIFDGVHRFSFQFSMK